MYLTHDVRLPSHNVGSITLDCRAAAIQLNKHLYLNVMTSVHREVRD
jgi:hypothetical protein